MLHLLESGVLGMWNDAVFPPPLSSSSLTSSSFNGDAAEIITWLQSSHASLELEKLNCGNNLFGSLQENYCSTGFLQRQFCSSPSVESNPGLVITGNGDPTTAEVEPAAVGGRSRKRGLIGRDAVDTRHQAPSRHSKRLKTTTTTTTSASSSPPKHQHHLPRNESTPSMAGMPLAKVPARRSQKLGDKITALQQLVSPFGKTDTASVLHEAALSIKFLHDQIRMLAAPYFGMRSPEEHLTLKVNGDLRRRGLCLVPKHTIVGLMDQAAYGTCLPDTAERKTDVNFY